MYIVLAQYTLYTKVLFWLGDPVEFLSWLLNELHYAVCAGDRKKSSIVHDAFQGEMKIYTRKLPPPTDVSEQVHVSITAEYVNVDALLVRGRKV